MARYLYVNTDAANGPTVAAGLGCGWLPAVPPEYASLAAAPCVIVAGAGQAVVLPDNGTLTAAKIQSNTGVQAIVAAEQAAAAAAASVAANAATIQAALTTRLGQIEAWIAANPTGATLTAAQTLTVGKMLAQLTRLNLQLTATLGQAN